MNSINHSSDSDKDVKQTSLRHRTPDFGIITKKMLKHLRGGNHDAYNTIYLNCFDPMLSFLRILLHNDADAEEICQDIFLKLWETRDQIDPDINFRSYLYTAARNAAYNYFKHEKVKEKYRDFRLKDIPELELSTDERIMTNELQLMIQVCVDNMPEQRRKAFTMNRIEGLSNKEIAEKLNIDQATVRYHISLAVKELRELTALFILLFFVGQ